MALIKINGVEIPTPSECIPGIMDISKAERNANGTMIIERIATKRKLDLSWKSLSAEELSKVLSAVSTVFFNVEYMDPVSNAIKIGTFYAGDRNCPMISFINGKPKYKDVKFNLIER